MDAREIVGWNLRRLRVEQGLSQERLALAASIDRAYVGRDRAWLGERDDQLRWKRWPERWLCPSPPCWSSPRPDAARPQPLRAGRRAGGKAPR